ncbi:MAG: tail protein X [Bacteroidota bacterium]|nr:tail protein X [Bacteroidota bacterium]
MSLLSTISAGTLTPMTITSYTDASFTAMDTEYTVFINPDQLTFNYKIKSTRQDVPGQGANTLKFSGVEPESVSFDIMFDTTGVIPGSSGDVYAQIKEFRALTYDYNGTIHRPNYLQLSWGSIIFKCVLSTLNVTYTLFSPQGVPLRAKASVTFEETMDPATIAREGDNQSPDMTHLRTVLNGDTLPLMCYRIYGDTSLYLEIARANGLDHFTELVPGMRIEFPPIAK